ncbi:MAG: hypothetical protein IAE79_28930 [Anaerolinea sp.]|nr:hypothetical protein [Anaerolinea sp.]
MSSVVISSSFNFLSDQDWDWEVSTATPSNIAIFNGPYLQTFAGSFVYDANGTVFGTTTSSSFYFNNALVYSVSGMSADATQLQIFASTYGDTQQTYAYVLKGNDSIKGSVGNDVLLGYAGDDTVDGGSGIDTAVYRGNLANYTLTKGAGGYTVRDNSVTDGTDTLTNVERLQFANAKLAIDLEGNAGTTAKILAAVFGAPSVANKEYVGIGLNLLDGGMSYENLMQLAINVKLGANATNTEVVNLLYTNLVGTPPGVADLAYFRDMLDQGVFTQASLGVIAAETSLNQGNVDLVGLSLTGIEFI